MSLSSSHDYTPLLRLADELKDATAEQTDEIFAAIAEFVLERVSEVSRLTGKLPLPRDHGLTSTQAATICVMLLEAADLEVFELAIWQSLGRKGPVEYAKALTPAREGSSDG